jgi:hypothetical protein
MHPLVIRIDTVNDTVDMLGIIERYKKSRDTLIERQVKQIAKLKEA